MNVTGRPSAHTALYIHASITDNVSGKSDDLILGDFQGVTVQSQAYEEAAQDLKNSIKPQNHSSLIVNLSITVVCFENSPKKQAYHNQLQIKSLKSANLFLGINWRSSTDSQLSVRERIIEAEKTAPSPAVKRAYEALEQGKEISIEDRNDPNVIRALKVADTIFRSLEAEGLVPIESVAINKVNNSFLEKGDGPVINKEPGVRSRDTAAAIRKNDTKRNKMEAVELETKNTNREISDAQEAKKNENIEAIRKTIKERDEIAAK